MNLQKGDKVLSIEGKCKGQILIYKGPHDYHGAGWFISLSGVSCAKYFKNVKPTKTSKITEKFLELFR